MSCDDDALRQCLRQVAPAAAPASLLSGERLRSAVRRGAEPTESELAFGATAAHMAGVAGEHDDLDEPRVCGAALGAAVSAVVWLLVGLLARR